MKKYIENYNSILDLKETEVAIKIVKDNFEKKLAKKLNKLKIKPSFVVKKYINTKKIRLGTTTRPTKANKHHNIFVVKLLSSLYFFILSPTINII